MATSTIQDTALQHLEAQSRTTRYGPLVWQHTAVVGTELVFPAADGSGTASGSAVVAGPLPHTTNYRVDLGPDHAVRALRVDCAGAGWQRTLRLSHDGDGWSCRTEETGDLGARPGGRGHQSVPMPGIEDPGRIAPAALIRLTDSPVFLTWALRRLGLRPGDEPVRVPTARILTPSLTVLTGTSVYQLVSAHRLRVSGDEPAATYELDDAGIVVSQPGRFRLAH